MLGQTSLPRAEAAVGEVFTHDDPDPAQMKKSKTLACHH
jgi:hypothetical protein